MVMKIITAVQDCVILLAPSHRYAQDLAQAGDSFWIKARFSLSLAGAKYVSAGYSPAYERQIVFKSPDGATYFHRKNICRPVRAILYVQSDSEGLHPSLIY